MGPSVEVEELTVDRSKDGILREKATSMGTNTVRSGIKFGDGLLRPCLCRKHVGAEGLMSHMDACSQKTLPFSGFPGGSVDKSLPASAGDTGPMPVREDSTCHRPTKLTRHDYWACALQAASRN